MHDIMQKRFFNFIFKTISVCCFVVLIMGICSMAENFNIGTFITMFLTVCVLNKCCGKILDNMNKTEKGE